MANRFPGISHFRDFIREQSATFDTTAPSYKWWLLANVMIGTFMAVLDATIVNVSLSSLASELHTTLATIHWVTSGYLLALALMLPLNGWKSMGLRQPSTVAPLPMGSPGVVL